MLFQRRHPPHWLEVLRVALWPRRSWLRSGKYFAKRVLRLTASPHAIAAGIAAGALASFTPFVGFHFVLSFVLAYVIGGNMLAAALGTSVGNPLTFPFIWAINYRVGSAILEGGVKAHHDKEISANLFENSFDTIMPILKPMLVGSIPLGLLVGGTLYAVVYVTVRTYQTARQTRLEARRATRAVKAAKIARQLEASRNEADLASLAPAGEELLRSEAQ